MLELRARNHCAAAQGSSYDDFGVASTEFNIFIVSDGISNHPASDEASSLASVTAWNFLKKFTRHFGKVVPEENISEYIGRAISVANHTLYTLSEHEDRFYRGDSPVQKKRSGATMDLCYFFNDILYVGHVGDSSVYLSRDKNLTHLTEDAERGEDENLRKLQHLAGERPIIDYVGKQENIEPLLKQLQLYDGDIVLMATDGITKFLYDEEISDILQKSPFRDTAVNLLRAARHPHKLASYIAQRNGEPYSRIMKQLSGSDAATVITMKACEVDKNG
jgi:PPM family protein phosphatase